MTLDTQKKLEEIWKKQTKTLVIWRKPRQPLMVRMPYAEGNKNRLWLQNGRRNNPKWLKAEQHWEIPAAWFNDTVDRALDKFGHIYIIQPYRESEECAPACWNAKGHECQCSCMGEHHGSQSPKGLWYVASDTFAIKWHSEEFACRLLKKKPTKQLLSLML